MISVVILTKNEEKQIETCLKSVAFADEIIVIDSGSTDKTLEIVKKYTKLIFKFPFTNFSELRNIGREKAKFDWIFYVDSDEEVTAQLKDEVVKVTNRQQSFSAYYLIRRNFYLGRQWPVSDRVERLFRKDKLVEWYGEVHESPRVLGEKGELKNEIIHRTHNRLDEMLTNTIVWSDFEAKARLGVGHPLVTWWRIFRMMITQFWDYYIRQKGYKVGAVGLIESIYQAFSIFVIYAKLWEMQRKFPLSLPRSQ